MHGPCTMTWLNWPGKAMSLFFKSELFQYRTLTNMNSKWRKKMQLHLIISFSTDTTRNYCILRQNQDISQTKQDLLLQDKDLHSYTLWIFIITHSFLVVESSTLSHSNHTWIGLVMHASMMSCSAWGGVIHARLVFLLSWLVDMQRPESTSRHVFSSISCSPTRVQRA
jgi:hypothetical protein